MYLEMQLFRLVQVLRNSCPFWTLADSQLRRVISQGQQAQAARSWGSVSTAGDTLRKSPVLCLQAVRNGLWWGRQEKGLKAERLHAR